MAHRAEVRAARLALDSARIEERRARNALLPALNLVGNYTLLGLGGIRRNVQLPGGDITAALAALAGSETEAYDDALDTLLSRDFYSYRIGLELDVPFSNSEARAAYERAGIAVRAAENQLRQVISDIALEIESAVGDVASAKQRVFAARLAHELAAENLRHQKKRYEVGMVTTTDVLRFQDKVVAAMASEIHAVADHARAVSRLARAEGTLLERYGIRVDSGEPGALPRLLRY
ncbi:MAG: TolC family protein [Deltaproteobacteria bacterium]|nr:MAG: TolC family protein [Deltaproteobacteria bacterium]